MSDKLLDKYTARLTSADVHREVTAGSEGEDAEDIDGAFGWVRGVRDRAICIELRRRDGHVLALPYAYISRMELDLSGKIVLTAGGDSITIIGRNLNNGSPRPLFQGITRHRVSYVHEASRADHLVAATAATVIEKIEW